jgi:hypothetical protein
LYSVPSCMLQAEPWLRNVAKPGNVTLKNYLKKRQAEAGSRGRLFKEQPFRLVRKIATIRNAVLNLPGGTVVVWMDGDCVILRPPDAEFLLYAREHDVATIGRGESYTPDDAKDFASHWWLPETGISTFAVGPASRTLLDGAKAMYEWGVYQVLAACYKNELDMVSQSVSTRAPRNSSELMKWICRPDILGFSDIQVIWMLAVGMQHPLWAPGDIRSLLGSLAASTLQVPALRVGWYALGCWRVQWPDDRVLAEQMQTYNWGRAKDSVLCPGQSGLGVSLAPFHIFRYIMHRKGTNGVLPFLNGKGTG